ncbi:hypothetical protein B0I35DRAFT_411988 [Stachybotrys elegans]|uniref:Uncharacterized protein n=1 Tax=Stachybotrys elegans TaxID=80388 RepID=A0A8K0WP13_9HYPO|nr:hypothetical protein B0I35DRAFT_411988 [Stachybotrys elegans]
MPRRFRNSIGRSLNDLGQQLTAAGDALCSEESLREQFRRGRPTLGRSIGDARLEGVTRYTHVTSNGEDAIVEVNAAGPPGQREVESQAFSVSPSGPRPLIPHESDLGMVLRTGEASRMARVHEVPIANRGRRNAFSAGQGQSFDPRIHSGASRPASDGTSIPLEPAPPYEEFAGGNNGGFSSSGSGTAPPMRGNIPPAAASIQSYNFRRSTQSVQETLHQLNQISTINEHLETIEEEESVPPYPGPMVTTALHSNPPTITAPAASPFDGQTQAQDAAGANSQTPASQFPPHVDSTHVEPSWIIPGNDRFPFKPHTRVTNGSWMRGQFQTFVVGGQTFNVPMELLATSPMWTILLNENTTPGGWNLPTVNAEVFGIFLEAVVSPSGFEGTEPGLNLVLLLNAFKLSIDWSMTNVVHKLHFSIRRYIAQRVFFRNPWTENAQQSAAMNDDYFIFRSEELYRAWQVVYQCNTLSSVLDPQTLVEVYIHTVPEEIWPALTADFSDVFNHMLDRLAAQQVVPPVIDHHAWWLRWFCESGYNGHPWFTEVPNIRENFFELVHSVPDQLVAAAAGQADASPPPPPAAPTELYEEYEGIWEMFVIAELDAGVPDFAGPPSPYVPGRNAGTGSGDIHETD